MIKKNVLIKSIIIAAALAGVIALGFNYKNNDEKSVAALPNVVNDASKNSDIEESRNNMDNLKETDIVPGENIIKSAEAYAVNAEDVQKMVKNEYEGTEKMVFLTFDDGPSPNTAKVLDILKEKGVHATFFVKGDMLNSQEADGYLKRIVNEGNAVGNHTYTHSLTKLYPNNKLDVDTFMNEFDQTNNKFKEILGKEFDSKVLRMPGGYMSRVYYNDASLAQFDKTLSERGVYSIDWDAMNGDAEGKDYSVQQLIDNVKNGTKGYKQATVLMHDTYGKEKTVEALPAIIDYFKDNGFEFKVIKNK